MNEDLRSPATLDPAKIRDQSARWTLAGDAGLLRYMEDSAERLVSRVAATSQQLNDSVWEATQAAVRFDNVHNQFVALAAKQFFENRVYDEDIPRTAEISSKPTQVKEAKTKAEREAETLASMREAVTLGCRLVGSHFKRIEIRPQDFDEDDDPTFKPEPIFEPLDPYLVRPLPFLIGSKEFAMSKSVGLVEQEEQRGATRIEESDDLVIDVGTRIPNPPSLAQRPATEALPATSEKAPSDHSGLYAASSGSGRSDELFADDHRVAASASRNDVDSLFNEPIENVVQPTSSRSIQDELAAKLGLPSNVVSGERKPVAKTITPSLPAQKAAAEDSENDADIFEVPPPLPQSNRTNVSAQPRKVDSLFETRTGGLFDSDEEDDLFAPPKPRAKGANVAASSTVASKPSVVEAKPPPAQVVSKPSSSAQIVSKPAPPPAATDIFDDIADEHDDHSDIFAPIANNTRPPAKTAQASSAAIAPRAPFPKTTAKSLFDDDSEEDDIFSAAPRKSEPKTTATKSSDLLTVPSQAPSKQKPTGGVSVFPSLDRSPALSATAVKTTEVIDPLADKRDEAIVDVRKAVEVDEKDERSSTGPSSAASSSSPVPVAAEKQLIPSDPSDNGPVSEVKQPSKPIGGVSVLPPLPTQSVRQENPVVVNKISEEKIKEDAATTDIHEPPALPSQPTEERTSPKSTPFALDDDSDDEDLFSPKGSTNSTPTANARENLANIMVAGLKKNIAQATAPSNPARIAPSSSAVDEPRDNDTTDQHRPLESLAKTRAKIPTSSRRPPSRRPFSPPQSSLFESDSDDDRVESASAPAQPATAAVASPVSLRPEPPIQPPVSVPNHEATPSSVGSNSAQSAKPPAAASMKSPLFGSDSDNDEGDSKPPPAASKTAATTATESPSNKPAQVTTPLPQANNKPVHADGTPVQAGGTPVQASASPAPQVEKEEPKLAPKAAAPAKAPARPAATALFDSDDDEDIFAPAPAKAAPAASSAPAKPPVKSATTATPSTAPAPLFADDDIDDIFAVNKPSNPAKAPVEPSKTSVPVKKTAPTAKSGALFGDDSDSDLDIFK